MQDGLKTRKIVAGLNNKIALAPYYHIDYFYNQFKNRRTLSEL